MGEGENLQQQEVILFDFSMIYKHNKDLINSYNFHKDNFKFSIEKKQLGTGGAILNGLNLINNNFFYLINGDIIFDIPLIKLKNTHLKD